MATDKISFDLENAIKLFIALPQKKLCKQYKPLFQNSLAVCVQCLLFILSKALQENPKQIYFATSDVHFIVSHSVDE